MTEGRIFEAVATDGERRDLSVLEDAGIAYDPTKAPLDLTRDEKRRVTSLMMAIQAYNGLIIKDAEMYLAICKEHRQDDGFKIKPATIDGIVDAAIYFDDFISGKIEERMKQAETVGEPPVSEAGQQE